MELIIHIGYAKTYTTTLQKNLFPNSNNFYLGKFYFLGRQFFGLTGKYMKSKFAWFFLKYIAILLNYKSILISKEGFLTFPNLIGPGNSENINIEDFISSFKNTINSIRFLKNKFGKIKIMISIRNQNDLLKSMYNHQKRYDRLSSKHSNNFQCWLNDLKELEIIDTYLNTEFIEKLIKKENDIDVIVVNVDNIFVHRNLTDISLMSKFLNTELKKTINIIENSKPMNITNK